MSSTLILAMSWLGIFPNPTHFFGKVCILTPSELMHLLTLLSTWNLEYGEARRIPSTADANVRPPEIRTSLTNIWDSNQLAC
jgi:hypothetical protein